MKYETGSYVAGIRRHVICGILTLESLEVCSNFSSPAVKSRLSQKNYHTVNRTVDLQKFRTSKFAKVSLRKGYRRTS